MIKKTKTFCSAPWFQIRNANNMSKKVCCEIKDLPNDYDSDALTPMEYLNSKDIIDLKKQLAEGKMPSVCDRCWNNEKIGIKSLREKSNEILTAGKPYLPNWMDAYFKHKKDYKTNMILMADIKTGNTCNHACVMCNPQDSSLIYNDWIKRKDSVFVKEYVVKDPYYFDKAKFNGYKNKKYAEYIDDIVKNNKNLRHLKLLGGEPFLDNMLITTLKNMDKKIKENLTLVITTNGSVDIASTLASIGKFKHITVNISLEGIGKVQEFARAGSNWKTLEKNILNTLDKKICQTIIWHTLQTSTVLGFESLLQWCKKHSIELSCGIVDHPDYLSIRSLSPLLKNTLLENVKSHQSILNKNDNIGDNTISYDNLILKIKDVEYDPLLNKKFFEYIEWYQCNKDIPKLQTIFPELYNQ